MTDADVSDAYVRLGDDFNRLVVVFTANGIETKLVSPKKTLTPPQFKPFHDLGSSVLSPKIYVASWRPV